MADKKKLDLPKDKVRVRLVLNDLYDSKKTEMKKEDTLMNKSLEKNGTLMGKSSRKKK